MSGPPIDLVRDFLPTDLADRCLQALGEEVPWAQRSIRLFGRDVVQPRLVAWVGDAGCSYRYSGVTLAPEPWTRTLIDLRERITVAAQARGADFVPNAVLCNRYRDGADSMGWHSDDEPELGPDPIVASLSLGVTRRFLFRSRGDRKRSLSMDLAHGSLLWMDRGTQTGWQHSLPKSPRVEGERINCTFRRIEPRE